MLNSEKAKNIGLLVLRLGIGIIFVMHGYGKLFGGAPGMTAFTGMVGKLGFPLPGLFAYAAALSEFFGGIALILGLYTEIFAGLIGIVMLVALTMVKKFKFPGSDIDLSLLTTAIALALVGPGKWALGCPFACKWHKPEPKPVAAPKV